MILNDSNFDADEVSPWGGFNDDYFGDVGECPDYDEPNDLEYPEDYLENRDFYDDCTG